MKRAAALGNTCFCRVTIPAVQEENDFSDGWTYPHWSKCGSTDIGMVNQFITASDSSKYYRFSSSAAQYMIMCCEESDHRSLGSGITLLEGASAQLQRKNSALSSASCSGKGILRLQSRACLEQSPNMQLPSACGTKSDFSFKDLQAALAFRPNLMCSCNAAELTRAATTVVIHNRVFSSR